MPDVAPWRLAGDWFDVCKCAIPCPCTFAQAPTHGDCEGILAWHIREGRYGDVSLDGLNVVALGVFDGNVWAGETKVTMGLYMDERADEAQRDAMTVIFSGEGGGWPAEFANTVGEVRGIEFTEITFEIADDLAYWAGRGSGKGEGACGGPHRADDSSRQARPDTQSARRRGRARPGCDLGARDDGPGRRLRLQVGVGRPLEQALPVRLGRPVGSYCRVIAIFRRSSVEIRWSRSSAASSTSICTHSTVPLKWLPSEV